MFENSDNFFFPVISEERCNLVDGKNYSKRFLSGKILPWKPKPLLDFFLVELPNYFIMLIILN